MARNLSESLGMIVKSIHANLDKNLLSHSFRNSNLIFLFFWFTKIWPPPKKTKEKSQNIRMCSYQCCSDDSIILNSRIRVGVAIEGWTYYCQKFRHWSIMPTAKRSTQTWPKQWTWHIHSLADLQRAYQVVDNLVESNFGNGKQTDKENKIALMYNSSKIN